MTRTNPLTLIALVVFGAGGAWFLETGMRAWGRPLFIPDVTLSIVLVLIGVIVVLMAVPVYRVARGKQNARVDPFYATRVVVLAKASSMSGALLTGFGLGMAGYLLTLPVVPPVGSVTMAFATAAGSVLLLIAGLIAEHMCTIPPENEDDSNASPETRGT